MSISKQSKKGTQPSYLESAIQNLSNLLNESSEIRQSFNTLPALKQSEINDDNIDQYISLLSERLLKIQEELIKEESLLFKAQEENIELKAKLSEEVKKQENTVKLGKNEIVKLSDQSKGLLNELQIFLRQKELLNQELQKIESDIAKALEEKEVIPTQIDSQKNQKELNQELALLKSELKNENTHVDSYERKLEGLRKEILELTSFNEEIEKKTNQIKEKIGKFEREKSCGDEKNSKFLSDFKASIIKKSKLDKKIEELEIIDRKFQEEISLKNQQLELGRRKNEALEIRKIKFETLLSQIALEKDLNSSLKMEKMALMKHLEQKILEKNNSLISETNKREINATNGSNFSDVEEFIEGIRASHKKIENCYDQYLGLPLDKYDDYHHILEENIKLEDKIQELEIKLAEKNRILDEVLKEKNNFEIETERLEEKLESNRNETNDLLEKYASLEEELHKLNTVKKTIAERKKKEII